MRSPKFNPLTNPFNRIALLSLVAGQWLCGSEFTESPATPGTYWFQADLVVDVAVDSEPELEAFVVATGVGSFQAILDFQPISMSEPEGDISTRRYADVLLQIMPR